MVKQEKLEENVQFQVGKDLACRLVKPGAGFVLRIYLIQGQDGIALDEQVLVLDDGCKPIRGGNNLIHTDFAVTVGVDHPKSLLVEFEALYRTAQHSPELLVKFAQMGDVFAVAYIDADYSAEGAVAPVISGVLFYLLSCHIDSLLCYL